MTVWFAFTFTHTFPKAVRHDARISRVMIVSDYVFVCVADFVFGFVCVFESVFVTVYVSGFVFVCVPVFEFVCESDCGSGGPHGNECDSVIDTETRRANPFTNT
jgi:hypothetical protein